MILAGYKSGHRVWMGAAAALLFTSVAHHAQAEGSDVAAAETLFREGKQRMAAKDYARGCPKLADSFKLDPATGTLLALAMCHERAGKLASAWAEYADAAARAKREARPDRERAAREKVAALEPSLSFLTISAPHAVSEISGLEISRNGAPVGVGTLGTPVPVDGGTYTIAASAPRRKPWSTQITIGASGERHTTTIPSLDESAAAPVVAEVAAPPAKPALELPAPPASVAAKDASMVAAQADTAKSGSGYGALAAATIAGGAVSLALGTTYMLRAMAKNEESQNGCSADRCSPVATQERLDARAFGNVATVGFLAGGALLAIGTTLYLVGSPAPVTRTATPARSSASLAASPFVGPGGFGGVLQGTF